MPEEISQDYPVGQMVEPYDIWRDEERPAMNKKKKKHRYELDDTSEAERMTCR